jgi:hypothetical protein
MLDKQTRGAILLLRSRGHSLRCISRLLSLSRDSVRKVVRVGSDEPPIIVRPSKLDAHRERIVQMLAEFDGLFASSATPQGSALLRIDLQGNGQVLWQGKGSIAPWGANLDIGMGGAPWAVPSPDGRHLAIYTSDVNANMWMMENF